MAYENPNKDYLGNTGVQTPYDATQSYLAQGGTLTNGQIPTSYAPTGQETISSTSLSATPSLAYQTPQQTPIYPVATLGAPAPMGLTGPEQQAQSETQDLQGLNSSLVGESAYRTAQEGTAGITEMQKTKTDLTSRLNALKNEALAIPLQIQNEGIGLGATRARAQVRQTEGLRNNAIQALSTNSLLEAANGNLTSALDMVDRAVKAKYDPIKEEIAAKTANLNLILNSPAYSVAEKNRAAAQKDEQDRRAKAVASQEATAKSVQEIAVNAAKMGADAMTLRKIQAATDPIEAQRIAFEAGFVTPESKDTQVVKLDNGQTVLIDTQTGQVISHLGGAKPGEADISGFSQTEKTLDQLAFLRSTAQKASELSGASGTSGMSRTLGSWFVGDTKYNQLSQYADTLRVNVLALTTDPAIKKFFGPQMSNADVRLMTSVGTTLNPENQSPAQLKEEITRLDELLTRMQSTIQSNSTATASGYITTAPDGSQVKIVD